MKNENIIKNGRSILMTLVIVYLAAVGLIGIAFAVPANDTFTGCLSSATSRGPLYSV